MLKGYWGCTVVLDEQCKYKIKIKLLYLCSGLSVILIVIIVTKISSISSSSNISLKLLKLQDKLKKFTVSEYIINTIKKNGVSDNY